MTASAASEPIDPAAVMARHDGHTTYAERCVLGFRTPNEQPCEPYRLAEQMRRWQWAHALGNDGCVPGAAYRDVCAALAAEQAKVARVEQVAVDQARPFPDGVPDREGEYVAEAIRAALADQPEQHPCCDATHPHYGQVQP